MGVEFTGDWIRCMKALDNLANKTKSEMGKKIGRSILKIEAKVQAHMNDQDLGWDELDAAYAARKAAAKNPRLSPDTLRATNRMYDNITTRQNDDFSGSVGVRRGVKNDDGEDVTDIAIIHEQPDNDGKIIPARKLWEPTYNEVKDDVVAELAGVVIKVLKA